MYLCQLFCHFADLSNNLQKLAVQVIKKNMNEKTLTMKAIYKMLDIDNKR